MNHKRTIERVLRLEADTTNAIARLVRSNRDQEWYQPDAKIVHELEADQHPRRTIEPYNVAAFRAELLAGTRDTSSAWVRVILGKPDMTIRELHGEPKSFLSLMLTASGVVGIGLGNGTTAALLKPRR